MAEIDPGPEETESYLAQHSLVLSQLSAPSSTRSPASLTVPAGEIESDSSQKKSSEYLITKSVCKIHCCTESLSNRLRNHLKLAFDFKTAHVHGGRRRRA